MPSKKGTTKSTIVGDHLALRYYRLGVQLLERDIVSDEEFRRLAAELGLRAGADAWYKSIRLAKLFRGKSAELIELCRVRTNGQQISWTHLFELVQVPSATQREKRAARAARLKLSCLTLRAEIRKANKWTSKRPGAGRKRREPKNITEAVWRAQQKLSHLHFALECLQKIPDIHQSDDLSVKLGKTLKVLLSLKETLEQLFVHRADLAPARPKDSGGGLSESTGGRTPPPKNPRTP